MRAIRSRHLWPSSARGTPADACGGIRLCRLAFSHCESSRIHYVGCVELAHVDRVSAQAAFGAGHTPSKIKTLSGERRRTDAWACWTHPTLASIIRPMAAEARGNHGREQPQESP